MSATMPIVTVELYDAGVRISDGENILADSISCALIESDTSIVVGEQAERQAYLRPREISMNFWGQLAENSQTKHVVSNAEIALQHLQHAWSLANCVSQTAILITPVTLEKHDLGLLLGICKKLSINVAGIVCNATLAMQHYVENAKAVYLDLLQRNLAVTELLQNDTGISLKQPSRVINYGLQSFVNNCAHSIANKFIAKTRFDPLHSAKDEQQFFDILPRWLEMLHENDSIECKFNTGEKHFTIDIHKKTLLQTNQNLFDELAAHLNVLFHNYESVVIFCSASCKQAFGLQEFLNTLPGCAIVQLDRNTIARRVLHGSNELMASEQVHYVNALSWPNNSKPDVLHFNSGRLSNLSSQPTHLLVNGHAHSLQRDIFIEGADETEPKLVMEKSSHALCKISTNNMNVEVQVFDNQSVSINHISIEAIASTSIGDVLNIDGFQTNYIFIKVVQHEA